MAKPQWPEGREDGGNFPFVQRQPLGKQGNKDSNRPNHRKKMSSRKWKQLVGTTLKMPEKKGETSEGKDRPEAHV